MAQSCRPNVMKMTAGDAKRFLEAQDKPTLVQFAADWCGHCQDSKPEVAAASAELCDSARVVRVNVDKAPQLADKFKVNELPDFVIMSKGKIVARIKGSQDRRVLVAAVRRVQKALAARRARGRR